MYVCMYVSYKKKKTKVNFFLSYIFFWSWWPNKMLSEKIIWVFLYYFWWEQNWYFYPLDIRLGLYIYTYIYIYIK